MKDFPLQEELIAAVVAFANAKITDPQQVRGFFSGNWEPPSVPSLPHCRKVQRETRDWLTQVARGEWPDAIAAMLGYTGDGKTEPGIRFVGALGFEGEWKRGKFRQRVVWQWWVKDASLRSICGLGVASILHADLKDRVGICAREGCGTFFIDRKSRGTRRQYCLGAECEVQRTRERVKRSRKQK